MTSRSSTIPDEPNLHDLLRTALQFLRRHLARMMLFGVLFSLIGLAVGLRTQPLYKSSVQLMVEKPVTTPIVAEGQPILRADMGYVDGQVLQIRSDDLLLRVIEREELTALPAFRSTPPNWVQQLIRDLKALLPRLPVPVERTDQRPDPATLTALKILSEALSVDREGDTNVISIDVRTTSPGLAQRVTTAVANAYIDLRLEQRQIAAREMSSWIDERADELRAQLAWAEAAVSAYRIENKLVGEVGGVTLGDQQLMEISAELIRAQADIAEKRASHELALRLMQGEGDPRTLPEVQNSVIISALLTSRLELQRGEQDIAQMGGGDSPRLVHVRRQMALVDAQIDEEVRRIVSVLENQTAALESRSRLLSEALERAGGQSELETRVSVELRELERVAEAFRARYERYLNSAGLAAEFGTITSSGTQLISAATYPLEPFYPPTKMFVILSFLFGTVVALILGVIREGAAPGFRSVDQIETETGLKVLAVLPVMDARLVSPTVVTKYPYSPFSEAISVLRHSLQVAGGRHDEYAATPVILVTSAGEGEGNTAVASALAVSSSAGGQKVLLVDADLRYAGLSQLFEMDGANGLCEILRGLPWQPLDDNAQSALDVMPAGDLGGALPANCLGRDHLSKFLKKAREHYDLVIVDGAPIANLADSVILAEHSTQIVVVLRADNTSREAFRHSMKRLPVNKIAGVVVNRADTTDTSGNWVANGYYTTSHTRSAQLYQLRNAALKRADRVS